MWNNIFVRCLRDDNISRELPIFTSDNIVYGVNYCSFSYECAECHLCVEQYGKSLIQHPLPSPTTSSAPYRLK